MEYVEGKRGDGCDGGRKAYNTEKSLLVNKKSCLMCDLKLQSIKKTKKMHGCVVEYSEHSEDATYTELVMKSELDF